MVEINVKQEIKNVEGDVTGLAASNTAATSDIKADISQNVGAVAAGGAVAGAVFGGEKGNVHIGGQPQYHNVIDTGGAAYIGGNVTVGGNFAGRDMMVHSNTSTGTDMNALFAPLLATVQSQAGEKSAAAVQKVEEIKAEASKGKQPDDSVLAELAQDLVDLVPGAVSAVVTAFGSPLLAGIAGPATNFMLKRLGVKTG